MCLSLALPHRHALPPRELTPFMQAPVLNRVPAQANVVAGLVEHVDVVPGRYLYAPPIGIGPGASLHQSREVPALMGQVNRDAPLEL